MVRIWVRRKLKHFFHFCLFINQTLINPVIDSNNKHIFPFMLPPPFVVVLEKRTISRAEQYFLKMRK